MRIKNIAVAAGSVLLVLLIAAPSEILAATYYVATTGNNSNPGTFDLPWLTIGKAASTMVAGDTTYIRGGTYNITTAITPTNSGSAGNYITFSAYQDEIPIIDGVSGNFRGFTLNSAHSYFRFVGLTMRNFGGTSVGGGMGIVRDYPPLGAYPHHIEIRNCTMDDCTGSCIKAHGVHDIIFAGNTFSNSKQGIELAVLYRKNDYNIQIIDCKSYNMTWDGVVAKGERDSGYDPTEWCEDVYISGCESYNCDDDGFDLFGRYFTIEHCVAHHMYHSTEGHGFKIYALDLPLDAGRYHADFYRCLTYDNVREGYHLSSLWIEESTDYPVKKFRMLNCTAADDNYGFALRTDATHAMNVEIKNSIISSNTRAWEIDGNTSLWIVLGEPEFLLPGYLTLNSDYNLWYANGSAPVICLGTLYTLPGWQSFSGVDGNSISQNPVFNANFYPTNPSCIDSGTDIGFPYAGDAPDMGAFESGTVEVNCPANYLTTGENWISIPVAAINDGPYSVFKELGTWPNTVYHNLYRYNSPTAGFAEYPTYQSDTVQFGKIVPGGAYKLVLDANVPTIHVSGIELSGVQELVIDGSGTRYFYFGNPFNRSLYKSHCKIDNSGSEVSIEQAISNGWISNVEHFNPVPKSWESIGNILERWHAYRLQALTAGELKLVIHDYPAGDFDGDDDVDYTDLGLMADNWLENNCSNVPVGNLDEDCDVDFRDYAIFAGNWAK